MITLLSRISFNSYSKNTLSTVQAQIILLRALRRVIFQTLPPRIRTVFHVLRNDRWSRLASGFLVHPPERSLICLFVGGIRSVYTARTEDEITRRAE